LKPNQAGWAEWRAFAVPAGNAAMQLEWRRFHIRFRKTHENASTKSDPIRSDAFAAWLRVYRRRLEESRKDADPTRIESTEQKGRV